MKKLFSFFTTICLVFSFSTSQVLAANFGNEPTDDVLLAASYHNNSSTGISNNNLAAIIFAVTWAETTGGSLSHTPAPMTIGRADYSGTQLWADGVKDSSYKYVRAHWSPGVGVWQLDSAGIGTDTAFYNRVFTNTASEVAAAEIVYRYNSVSGSAVDKRKYAWKPWYACGSTGATCESIYQTIYNGSTDVISISRDNSVTRRGGMQIKTCYNVNTPSSTFTCYKYDAALAQGHKGSWYYTPYNGSSTLEPVPLPFYSYYSGTTEFRHWLMSDTGYDNSKWAARAFGTNARISVNWYSDSELGVY